MMVHVVHLHVFVTLPRERVQEVNTLDPLRRTETGNLLVHRLEGIASIQPEESGIHGNEKPQTLEKLDLFMRARGGHAEVQDLSIQALLPQYPLELCRESVTSPTRRNPARTSLPARRCGPGLHRSPAWVRLP